MRVRAKFKALATAFLLLAGTLVTGVGPAKAQSLSELTSAIDTGHWAPYVATKANPHLGPNGQASEDSIRTDLQLLKARGFTGVSTYGCDNNMLENLIPKVCDELGLKVIIGVWNPLLQSELDAAARSAAKYKSVIAVSVGNEGGTENASDTNPNSDRRYTFAKAKAGADYIRGKSGKPTTTVEQFEKYSNETLMSCGDFLMPNIHPYWNKIYEPSRGVDFTMEKYSWLKSRTSKPVFVKETGYPTAGGNGMSEQVQADFYKELATKPIHFMYFEAFDCLWKTHNQTEPHWGIYKNNRQPKATVNILPF